MKFNKRAQTGLTGPQIVVIIVFSLIVFVIIYLAIVDPFFISKGPSEIGDQACHFNAMLDNAVTGKDAAHPLQIWMCPERSATIYASDWDKCPKTKEEYLDNELITETLEEEQTLTGAAIFKKEITNPKVLKACAQEQLFDYTLRCWQMYGSGKWNFGIANWDYDCFKLEILDLADEKITETSFTEYMVEQGYCDMYFGNTKIGTILERIDCGSTDAIWWDGNMAAEEYWTIRFHDGKKANDQLVFRKA